jgi:hypothetical protein
MSVFTTSKNDRVKRKLEKICLYKTVTALGHNEGQKQWCFVNPQINDSSQSGSLTNQPWRITAGWLLLDMPIIISAHVNPL